MRFTFRIQYLKFKNEMKYTWWKDIDLLEKIIRVLNKHFSLVEYKYFKYKDKLLQINDIEDIIDKANKMKEKRDSFNLMKYKEDEDYIDISVTDEEVDICIYYEKDSIIENIKRIDIFEKLIVDLYDNFKNIFYFGAYIYVGLIDYNYPRLKPMRKYEFLGEDSLINFLSKAHFEAYKELVVEGMEYLYSGELPTGATRKIHDNELFIIRWFDKIKDEKDIERCLIQREDWIYKNMKLKPYDNFTEEGDKLFDSPLEKLGDKDPFFTFYRPSSNLVFKSVVLTKDNNLSQDVADTIKRYSETKSLANGEPIDKIILIVPARKYAMAIQEKAKDIGAYKVFYIDNEGRLWNPLPPGNWRN